jgi:uncharacterized protein (DUF433 family)
MIVRTPGTLGGRPRIDGTRIGVDTIAIRVFRHGIAPEILASDEYWPYVSLAQIYAALAYYHANKSEIDAEIAADALAYELGALKRAEAGRDPAPLVEPSDLLRRRLCIRYPRERVD